MKVVFVVILGAAIGIFGGVIWFNRFLAAGSALAVALLASVLYQTYFVAPACDSDDVTFAVTQELSSKFTNHALSNRHIRTLEGGLLSSRNKCEMQVTPMLAYGAQGVQKWTTVTYSTSWSKPNGDVDVQARIAGQ